jgi:hypothetical protein
MVGAIYRVEAWDKKLRKARLLADLTALLPAMTTRMEARTIALCAMETSVKQTVDAAGEPTINYPGYLNFGREMFRKISVQEFSGESMAKWAALCIAKWVARGLTQSVLQAIRSEVFSVPAPVAP